MVNNQSADLDAVFAALSDPTRRAIVERLALGELTVTEISRPFSFSLPAITKHLNVLADAGLIERKPVGRQRICRVVPQRLESAAKWIDRYKRFWTAQLDALDEYLATQETENQE